MMKGEVVNAKIESTKLGFAGGNIPTFYVFIKMEHGGCGVGGFSLGEYDRKTDKWIYSGKNMEAIMRVCEVVGVENWEDLKDRYCRVVSEGWGSCITKIGNIIKDEWFDLREFFQKVDE